MKTLDECLINEEVIVKKVNSNGDIKRRFLDMGLSSGTKVICLYNSICGGIRAYKVRNTLVGIRDIDARGIVVYE